MFNLVRDDAVRIILGRDNYSVDGMRPFGAAFF
jgi:hypothetical protein